MHRREWIAAALCGLLVGVASAEQPKPGSPTQDVDVAEAVAPSDRQHNAVAGLASLNLYTTHGGLGVVATGFEKGAHSAADVERITSQVVKLCDVATKLLKDAVRESPDLGRKVPVDRIVESYYHIERDARLLASAAKSGKPDDLQRYHQAREQTWAGIAALLGIEADETSATEGPAENTKRNEP